jgi:uroporphyrin-III C-methyltransferase
MKNLLISLNSVDEVYGVIGDSPIAFTRINSIIESGARVVLMSNQTGSFPPFIQEHMENENLKFIQCDYSFDSLRTNIMSQGRCQVQGILDRVFVALPSNYNQIKEKLHLYCRENRIPINTADSPQLSTFSLLSTYTSGDFQLGVSTSGKGCKLASRIKQELVSSLPHNIDEICNIVGQLRQTIYEEDELKHKELVGDLDDDAITTSSLNSLVYEFNDNWEQRKLQRSRWLSQIVQYYPLNRLSQININDLTSAYQQRLGPNDLDQIQMDITRTSEKQGSISLIGSGPGSVSLLTLSAFQAIYDADLILADKLVPQQILDLIPQHRTKLFIARKFPGNAEAAQQELLQMGLDALAKGEKVVRLKQGDPYIFGRGGEEYNYFVHHGYTPVVVPGLTSALAAPVLANIPVTHRGVANQVLICTGTGKRGTLPDLPEFNKTRTTVFLMALHRIIELIPKLIEENSWDPDLPVAIIEKASSPDQRIIRTTLSRVAQAVEACGSRPPGLFVTGYACEALYKTTASRPWVVEEGFQLANLQPILKIADSVFTHRPETVSLSKEICV